MQEFFNNNVQSLDTYIMFKIKETVARITPDLVAKNRAPISLAMGAPTQAPPKFVVEALKKALDIDGIHTYSTPRGEKYFLEAISKRMKDRFGVDIDPACEIFSLIGSKEGLANFIRLLINPTCEREEKDIVMIPDPGYASYKEFLKVSGGLAYPIPLTAENNYMPDLEELLTKMEKEGLNPKKVKALIINYPNNPLGATATREYLESVVAFCKKYNENFNKNFLGFTQNALKMLYDYYWPGNILELKNVIERACMLGQSSFIESSDLHLTSSNFEESPDVVTFNSDDKTLKTALHNFKKKYVIQILDEVSWNQTEAAKIMDIQRTYLSKLMSELDIRR